MTRATILIALIAVLDGVASVTATACSATSQLCGTIQIGPPTSLFHVDLTDPVDPATLDATDFTMNGISAAVFTLSNGNTRINFFFVQYPIIRDINVMHIPAGAFNCSNGPVAEFTCDVRWVPTRPRPTPWPRPGSPTSS